MQAIYIIAVHFGIQTQMMHVKAPSPYSAQVFCEKQYPSCKRADFFADSKEDWFDFQTNEEFTINAKH